MLKRMMIPVMTAGALAVVGWGCVNSHRGGVREETHVVTVPTQRVERVIVTEAPPEPKSERIGSPPDTRSVWVAGYWMRVDQRWVWVPGHWETRPAATANWIPGRWEKDPLGKGWVWTPGHWD